MNSEINEPLAARLRHCAEIAGSGDNLARKSAIPRRTLEYYLTGQREPKASKLVAIADAVGVTVEWLVSGRGSMFPQPADFNRELFIECWQAVDALLDALGEKKAGKQRISLVFQVYDECIVEKAGGRGLDMANVIRLVKKTG